MQILYIILTLLACLIFGYLFGSIPNSIIISKVFFNKDPRKLGSGNAGGTNVGRTVSKRAGVIVIILDILKTVIPFIITLYLFTGIKEIVEFMDPQNLNNGLYWYGTGNSLCNLAPYLAILGTFLGHSYSVFLGFKGGKIVSTYSGLVVCNTYLFFPLFIPIFLIVLKITKYVSLASMTTAVSYCMFTWIVYLIYIFTNYSSDITNYLMWFGLGSVVSIYSPVLSTLGTIFMIFKHRSNIKKLINKTENKIKWMK